MPDDRFIPAFPLRGASRPLDAMARDAVEAALEAGRAQRVPRGTSGEVEGQGFATAAQRTKAARRSADAWRSKEAARSLEL